MQDSIDNELYRGLKFSVEDLAVATAECLDNISRQEPDIAKQQLAELQVIFVHLDSSLGVTNYTNIDVMLAGMQWHISQIKKVPRI